MWPLVDALTQEAATKESAVLVVPVNSAAVVVRDGGKCENARRLTDRERFRLRRDVVYAGRALKRYGIRWKHAVNPLSGIHNWRLIYGSIVADVRDAGIMSYCTVTIDGIADSRRHPEEEFAGFGGVSICVLRGTQHVLALIDERARAAEHALANTLETEL